MCSSENLHKRGSLLCRLAPQHHPHTDHGDGGMEAIVDLESEAVALSVHYIQPIGVESVLQLLLVVNMEHVTATKLLDEGKQRMKK